MTTPNSLELWDVRREALKDDLYPQPATDTQVFYIIRENENLRQRRNDDRLMRICVWAAVGALGIVLYLAAQ